MITYNQKQKIVEHYDFLSPYYNALWGKHLHHGYWVTGKESKETAQEALTEYLAGAADIKSGSRILDVGCGMGASSIYLAKSYQATTTGITISPVQIDMAKKAAVKAETDSHFLLMDAEEISFDQLFDVIWSIESISHYKNKEKFFQKAVHSLKIGGTVALIDWFKKEDLTEEQNKKYITPIEKGMLVQLHTMNDYSSMLKKHGLQILKSEDISKNTAKTWDISLDIIKNKAFWQLALKSGKDFINFLRSFKAMKSGFSSGNFIYGMIIAKSIIR